MKNVLPKETELLEIIKHEIGLKKAIQELRSFDPRTKQSMFLLGMALGYSGEIQNAVRVLDDAASRYQSARADSLRKVLVEQAQMYTKGVELAQKKRVRDAIVCFQATIERDRKNKFFCEKGFYGMTRLFYEGKRYDDAIKVGLEGLDVSPRFLPLLKILGHSYHTSGEFVKAKEMYAKFNQIDSRNEEINKLLKSCQIEINRKGPVNYYKVLGVSKKATVSQITIAWKRMARRSHPDMFTSEHQKKEAEGRMAQINEAKTVLCDRSKRRKHDGDLDEADFFALQRNPFQSSSGGSTNDGGSNCFWRSDKKDLKVKDLKVRSVSTSGSNWFGTSDNKDSKSDSTSWFGTSGSDDSSKKDTNNWFGTTYNPFFVGLTEDEKEREAVTNFLFSNEKEQSKKTKTEETEDDADNAFVFGGAVEEEKTQNETVEVEEKLTTKDVSTEQESGKSKEPTVVEKVNVIEKKETPAVEKSTTDFHLDFGDTNDSNTDALFGNFTTDINDNQTGDTKGFLFGIDGDAKLTDETEKTEEQKATTTSVDDFNFNSDELFSNDDTPFDFGDGDINVHFLNDTKELTNSIGNDFAGFNTRGSFGFFKNKDTVEVEEKVTTQEVSMEEKKEVENEEEVEGSSSTSQELQEEQKRKYKEETKKKLLDHLQQMKRKEDALQQLLPILQQLTKKNQLLQEQLKMKDKELQKEIQQKQKYEKIILQKGFNEQRGRSGSVKTEKKFLKKILSRDITRGEMIGKGGYGNVFKAIWDGEGGGIDVCLKELNLHNKLVKKEDIQKEVKMYCQLNHPCVCNILGCYTSGNFYYIVMELLEDNLWNFVRKNHNKLSYYKMFMILKRMSISVNYLSIHGIIHRDIRADNFLVCSNGRIVKITDFGISKFKKSLTQSVMTLFKGNPSWQPSECHGGGERPFSTKSDMYSLAMSFYQVLFNKLPFEGMEETIGKFEKDLVVENPILGNMDKGSLVPLYVIPSMVKAGVRPEMKNESVPTEFKKLLKKMWKHNRNERIKIGDLVKWFRTKEKKFKMNYSNKFFKKD